MNQTILLCIRIYIYIYIYVCVYYFSAHLVHTRTQTYIIWPILHNIV